MHGRFKVVNDHSPEQLASWKKLATPRPPKFRSPLMIVMSALENGCMVRLGQWDLVMALDDFEDVESGTVGTVLHNATGSEIMGFLPQEFLVQDIARWANAMSTEELVLIAATTTLRKQANENVAERERRMAEKHKFPPFNIPPRRR